MNTPDIRQTMALLSALVHADEMLSYLRPSDPSHLNPFEKDKAAFDSALNDCKGLLAEYDAQSMIPLRRDGVRYK
jgi:hypothetical protein